MLPLQYEHHMVLELLKHGHPEADRKVRSCNINLDPCNTERTAWPHLAYIQVTVCN